MAEPLRPLNDNDFISEKYNRLKELGMELIIDEKEFSFEATIQSKILFPDLYNGIWRYKGYIMPKSVEKVKEIIELVYERFTKKLLDNKLKKDFKLDE